MRGAVLFISVGLISAGCAQMFAQDAAQPSVNVSPTPPAEITPPPAEPSQTPVLPELSALDQAFNQTGLGKDADENRMRVEIRKLQNQVAHDPSVIEARAAADAARTDLDKREKLRDYYNLTYGLMSKRASSSALKAAIEQQRAQHVGLLAQPRVRPNPNATETPAPTPKKKHKKSKRF